jgi:hypothetical protein
MVRVSQGPGAGDAIRQKPGAALKRAYSLIRLRVKITVRK